MSRITIIGAGPAGLMAAEALCGAGHVITVHDRMPSLGRKLLMAGRGGLNLTHSEPYDRFLTRYGSAQNWIKPYLDAFRPQDAIDWAADLGQPTFTGSSGRIFPVAMKASPLLRAWLGRLDGQGVNFRTRSNWSGWDAQGALMFDEPGGAVTEIADAVVLAFGGASWPRLGSNGKALSLLAANDVATAPFAPSNAGVEIGWSEGFRERFAGHPLKGAAFMLGKQTQRGEALVTAYGLEGGAIYARSKHLRALLATRGSAALTLDLRPDMDVEQLGRRIAQAPAHQSISNRLRKAVQLGPLEMNLLREGHGVRLDPAPAALAAAIKSVPLTITGMRGLERAISSAGGVTPGALTPDLMLTNLPGVFCAGEMLDWEAPTGGYLLQACLATGRAAGLAARRWLEDHRPDRSDA